MQEFFSSCNIQIFFDHDIHGGRDRKGGLGGGNYSAVTRTDLNVR